MQVVNFHLDGEAGSVRGGGLLQEAEPEVATPQKTSYFGFKHTQGELWEPAVEARPGRSGGEGHLPLPQREPEQQAEELLQMSQVADHEESLEVDGEPIERDGLQPRKFESLMLSVPNSRGTTEKKPMARQLMQALAPKTRGGLGLASSMTQHSRNSQRSNQTNATSHATGTLRQLTSMGPSALQQVRQKPIRKNSSRTSHQLSMNSNKAN